MASTATAPSPDMPVHIKISVNGDENRKFKLPLKELGASTLPSKLRGLLAIPDSSEATFERYSDSSAAYITLDSSNTSTYKQLYRAAKAKGKLRLRATVKDAVAVDTNRSSSSSSSSSFPVRKYVSPYVSDTATQEPPMSSRLSTLADLKTLSDTPANVPVAITPMPKAKPPSASEIEAALKASKAELIAQQMRARGEHVDKDPKVAIQDAMRQIKERVAARNASRQLVDQLKSPDAPLPQHFTARDHCRAEHTGSPSSSMPEAETRSVGPRTGFFIYCNRCDASIPDAHWHCSVCDSGDFDLCQACVSHGVSCNDSAHWLIKRHVSKGYVVSSTTETIPQKKVQVKTEDVKVVPGAFEKAETTIPNMFTGTPLMGSRTCNACVQVFSDAQFITCLDCEDYDLCVPCHLNQDHGHHPGHQFAPVKEGLDLTRDATLMLAPGRDVQHQAICDGCDLSIFGVRHKCLTCPDFDYCSNCIQSAAKDHPKHRFVPLYEPLNDPICTRSGHPGVYCDGPLCKDRRRHFIKGDRYKCAVCHDTDFCADCEAHPLLQHNPTHPLLKFKTPVRNVTVSTYGDKNDGTPMTAMGDRQNRTSSKATETTPAAPSANAATQVQTVAEVKPFPVQTTVSAADKQVLSAAVHQMNLPTNPRLSLATNEAASIKPADLAKELNAHFMSDTVYDGSIVAPGSQLTQVWTMHNPGPHAWPKGSCIYFIGGDSMLDVDPTMPTHMSHLRRVSKSNETTSEVAPGESAEFTVTMRAPGHEGHCISYWRLKTPTGVPFGHKLWCDVVLKNSEAGIKGVEKVVEPETKQESTPAAIEAVNEQSTAADAAQSESQMIFPKLDKESPVESTADIGAFETVSTPAAPVPAPLSDNKHSLDDVESIGLDDEDDSSEGFLTDEEYELIASGDEFEEARNGRK